MRQNKKAFEKHDILFWLGLPYSIMGGVFAVIGLTVMILSREWIFGLCFGGIGLIFLVLGVIFLRRDHRRRQAARRLYENGRYIWGEVVELAPNYNIRVNNRHPYVAKIRYVDGAGIVHIFTSPNLYRYPDGSVLQKSVKVYVEDDTFQRYYVDMDEILPDVREH